MYQVDNIVLFIVMCFSLSESNSYYMATMNYPRIALMLKMGLSIIHSYVGKMIYLIGPLIRGKIRRVLRKMRTFRINGTFCLK